MLLRGDAYVDETLRKEDEVGTPDLAVRLQLDRHWVGPSAPKDLVCEARPPSAPRKRLPWTRPFDRSLKVAERPPGVTPRDAERNRADVETVYGALPETLETTEVSMFPNILLEKRKPGARRIAG